MKKNTNIGKFAAVVISGALSQFAFAADGTISFNGEIVDTPCSISPATQNLIVPLGNVARTVLDGGAGKKATPARFNLELMGCGASANGATVTFNGTPDADLSDSLRIGVGEAGAATGVAIELGDSNGTKIALGSESGEFVLAPGNNPLRFQAVYVSTLPAVTVGPANAVAQFTVNYK